MTASKIEWTDRSDWNPVRGCTRVSPGCGGPGPHGGCYAEAMAGRFSDPGQWGHGFAERTASGGRWTGKVEIQWDRIDLPLRWRKAAKIFASSTSDLFHTALAMEDVAHLFGVMIAAHHLHGHILQVLTKRADVMRAWLNNELFWEVANCIAEMEVMARVDPLDRRSDDARASLEDYGPDAPPPGIWLAVSVEDQPRADERREDFENTPAAVKFVSYEPALGPVDWTGWEFVDQIISGGESGPKARPSHPDWHRATRDFCAAKDIAYFFKQWGEWAPYDAIGGVGWMNRTPQHSSYAGPALGAVLLPEVGYTDRAFPTSFMADGGISVRVGKKRAGRLLDGVEHNGMPGHG